MSDAKADLKYMVPQDATRMSPLLFMYGFLSKALFYRNCSLIQRFDIISTPNMNN